MADIEKILKLADQYNDYAQDLIKIGKIRKLPNGQYRVLSEKGKNLGTFKNKDKAKKRLNQVHFFKNFDYHSADDVVLDLTKAEEFSFSALMRQVNKNGTPEQTIEFIKLFKKCFDKAIKDKVQKPEKVALQNCMLKFNKLFKVKISKDIVKNAAISELGTADQVGKYLSDIVKFIIARMPVDSREKSLNNLKQKFLNMHPNEIASKNLPASAAVGQSITFVKHVLFNHDASFIKEVLLSLVNNI
jgi:hypothetical protein